MATGPVLPVDPLELLDNTKEPREVPLASKYWIPTCSGILAFCGSVCTNFLIKRPVFSVLIKNDKEHIASEDLACQISHTAASPPMGLRLGLGKDQTILGILTYCSTLTKGLQQFPALSHPACVISGYSFLGVNLSISGNFLENSMPFSMSGLSLECFKQHYKQHIFQCFPRTVLLTTGAVGVGFILDKWHEDYYAAREAMFRHYIQLHPEDFPSFEQKKYSEVLDVWYPIR